MVGTNWCFLAVYGRNVFAEDDAIMPTGPNATPVHVGTLKYFCLRLIHLLYLHDTSDDYIYDSKRSLCILGFGQLFK